MRFQTKLVPAVLIRRYKRFLADIRLQDGREVTAHCPNPGSMMGLAEPGMKIWVEPNDDPKKKLKFGWRLAQLDNAMVVVDTGIANKVVKEALLSGQIPGLSGEVLSEVKYGQSSRADFLVTQNEHRTWVEVKSVTLSRQPGLMEFPDSKTARGAKHLGELSAQVAEGDSAVMLYLVSRTDGARFQVAEDIDPNYGRMAVEAKKNGVKELVFNVTATPDGVTFDERELPTV